MTNLEKWNQVEKRKMLPSNGATKFSVVIKKKTLH